MQKKYTQFVDLSGEGIKNTLSYFEKINIDLQRQRFASGTKVFD